MPLLSRRSALVAGLGFIAALPAAHAAEHHAAHGVSPDEAMARLMEGNQRFVSGRLSYHGQGPKRRAQLTASQTPFAVILACADSRVAPELLFDQGLGDLFVVRVAGNVVDDALLGSIEYAVEHLGSSLVLALGHERCGAVKATIEAHEGKFHDEEGGHIGALATAIMPAVERSGGDLDGAVRLNARQSAENVLKLSPPLKRFADRGALKVAAAHYDLDTGAVEVLA